MKRLFFRGRNVGSTFKRYLNRVLATSVQWWWYRTWKHRRVDRAAWHVRAPVLKSGKYLLCSSSLTANKLLSVVFGKLTDPAKYPPGTYLVCHRSASCELVTRSAKGLNPRKTSVVLLFVFLNSNIRSESLCFLLSSSCWQADAKAAVGGAGGKKVECNGNLWEAKTSFLFSRNADLKINSRNYRKPFWILWVREKLH